MVGTVQAVRAVAPSRHLNTADRPDAADCLDAADPSDVTDPTDQTDGSGRSDPSVDALSVQVDRLRAHAASLVDIDLTAVDPMAAASLHGELRGVVDRLGLAAARLLAVVEADGRWSAGGARTFPEWVARRQGSSVGAARTEARLGQALDADLAGTRAAVAAGQITLEHAQVLARVAPTSPARRAALASTRSDRNEDFLLARARAVGVDEFRREARRWAMRVDAQAAETEHGQAVAKEYLTLSPRHDGVALQGFLTAEHGAALATALRAVRGVPAADDSRTPQERDGAALGDLARVVLDKGLVGGGAQVRPHLTVTVSWETLQGLTRQAGPGTGTGSGVGVGVGSSDDLAPAELDSGEPLPASVLARIACDSEMSRVVFGPDSQVLDVGRAHRTYGGHLRRAVLARDRHCQYPTCTAPPHLGEVHHRISWASGGPTSVENGILLCWFHHDLVHRRHLSIDAPHGGRWIFRRPDGSPLAEETSPPGLRPEPPRAHPPPASPRPSPPASPQPPTPDALTLFTEPERAPERVVTSRARSRPVGRPHQDGP